MNFIIYEDNNEFVSSYKEVIFSVMSHSNIDYNTIVVNKYDEDKLLNVTGKKIQLLDVEVPGKNGIDVARCIRNNNDWSSPIIVITSHDEYKTVGYTSRILMLDFITKNDSFMDKKITYHEETNRENTKKLREVLATLPTFTRDFFRAMEPNTSAKTRISLFFNWLRSCWQVTTVLVGK